MHGLAVSPRPCMAPWMPARSGRFGVEQQGLLQLCWIAVSFVSRMTFKLCFSFIVTYDAGDSVRISLLRAMLATAN